jgi:hypothetical protein
LQFTKNNLDNFDNDNHSSPSIYHTSSNPPTPFKSTTKTTSSLTEKNDKTETNYNNPSSNLVAPSSTYFLPNSTTTTTVQSAITSDTNTIPNTSIPTPTKSTTPKKVVSIKDFLKVKKL